MSDLTDQDLIAIYNGAISLGKDPASVRPVNPYSLESPTAKTLQMAIEGNDPAAAARMRRDAGVSANLSATMASRGLIEHTPATRAELRAHDPDFLRQEQQDAVADYQKQLAWMDQEAERKARARMGDRKFEAEQLAQAQHEQQLKAQREIEAQSAKEMAQRQALQKQQLQQRMEAMAAAHAASVNGVTQ